MLQARNWTRLLVFIKGCEQPQVCARDGETTRQDFGLEQQRRGAELSNIPMVSIAIRDATVADSAQIAQLVSDLGYRTSSSQMHMRLESILGDHDYHTLVACEGDQIVGFIGTRVGPLYESDDLYGQIMALAVARDRQRAGVGQMLVRAAESILILRGARVLVVTSGNHRADAHAFYEKNGYTFSGRRYKKALSS